MLWSKQLCRPFFIWVMVFVCRAATRSARPRSSRSAETSTGTSASWSLLRAATSSRSTTWKKYAARSLWRLKLRFYCSLVGGGSSLNICDLCNPGGLCLISEAGHWVVSPPDVAQLLAPRPQAGHRHHGVWQGPSLSEERRRRPDNFEQL